MFSKYRTRQLVISFRSADMTHLLRGFYQYCALTGVKKLWYTQHHYIPSNTLASEMSLTAAASTMFLMTNFLMALSLGTQRAQLVQRMG